MANPPPRLTRRALIGVSAAAMFGPKMAFAATRFTPYPTVKTALQSRQTGLFRIAELGAIETILLCVNGTPTEVHARRNGIYQRKDAARSNSPRDISPVDFNRLITAAGGLDQPVNGTARSTTFYALYNQIAAAPETDSFGILAVAGETPPRLGFSADPFFAGWAFTYDARNGAYAFSAGDLRAHWFLEGQP